MNIRQDNICLVLTATITPNASQVALTEPEQRRNQYLEALRYYRKHFHGKIYFLENSNYNWQNDPEFLAVFDENTLLFNHQCSKNIDKGKGFLEFEMLDAFFTSGMVSQPYFIKITGRYLVKNLQHLIPRNYTTVIADAHKKMKVTLSGVFISSVAHYLQYISGLYTQVDDSNYRFIEHMLYEHLTEQQLTELFRVNPVIEGVSGSYGASLRRNPLKMKIRQIERQCLNRLRINRFLIEY